jgi:hypothetical protein
MGRGVNIYKRVFARDVWEKVLGASAVCISVCVGPSSLQAGILASVRCGPAQSMTRSEPSFSVNSRAAAPNMLFRVVVIYSVNH